ncbi:MAG: D-tyrosyl-tRNA(Tyr) deacylase, partial [Armatimonadetes bacterium]|nr:D-tyrosyl-tRNA(Tyr) deacylase [Armatimonadota bacterium]
GLGVFEDSDGKMNLDLVQAEGALLMVSNFTVCGDASKGRRPSFDKAAGFEDGRELFDSCVRSLRESGLEVETGRYGERMQVSLVNDGPVTLVIDSPGGER